MLLRLLILLFALPAQADLLIDIGGRTVNVHEPPGYDPPKSPGGWHEYRALSESPFVL